MNPLITSKTTYCPSFTVFVVIDVVVPFIQNIRVSAAVVITLFTVTVTEAQVVVLQVPLYRT